MPSPRPMPPPRRSRRPLLGVVVASLALLLGVVGAEPVAAQVGERIEQYDVGIVVEADGSMVVDEVIEYDFGAARRHGILRDIPVRFRYDDTHDRIYPFELISVTADPGTPSQARVETAGAAVRIRIGSPSQTITGRHTYHIRYRVHRVLNGFEDHDELFWNAIGSEWQVPIDEVHVRVDAPARVTAATCFAGPRGSTLPCPTSMSSGEVASFAGGPLGPHEAFTVVVGFPTGVVPSPQPLLEERWSVSRAFAVTPATVGTSLALLLLAIGGIGALVWRTGRDRRFVGSAVDVAFGNVHGETQPVPLIERTETPVEFVPPDGFRPGQLGTLLDEVAHPLDVTATIIDLAVRGHLRIEELPDSGMLRRRPDWLLTRLEGRDDLRGYERRLLQALFEDAPDGVVRLSDLRDRFAVRLREVQDDLYDDAVAQGWFRTRPDHVRQRWVALGVFVLVVGVAMTVAAAATTSLGLVPVPIALGGLLLVAASRWMPHRTARGTATLRRALGFRRFIVESEAERARFAERQHLFSEYLPYAVVFGVTEQWARTFAGLAGPDGSLPPTPWYVGYSSFSAIGFSSAMSDFTVTSAGTFTSTPAASGGSGFSGGGFAGGGAGGGGGGSW